MNNESFLINELDLDIAKDICKFIDNNELRNRAAANATATVLAKKYFEDVEVDTESGLHNVCQVLEDIEISDIYIKDNYIDVRLYFDDNGIFVPKSHFDNNLLPVAYMFIKVDTELSQGIVPGFILPSNINTENNYDGYYKINENEFISYYDVESAFINKYEEGLSENFENQIYEYLDGRLEDTQSFYQTLINSKEARLKLINAAKAKTLFDFISIPQTETHVNDTEQEQTLEVEDISETFELETNDSLEDFSIDSSIEELPLNETIDIVDSFDNIESEDNNDFAEAENDILEVLDEQVQSLEEYEVESEEIEPSESFEQFESEIVSEENVSEYEHLDLDTASDETSVNDENSFTQELDIIENIEEANSDNETASEFEYSTNITPSIDSFETEEINEEALEQILNAEEAEIPAENESIQTEQFDVSENSKEEIDTLFNNEDAEAIPVAKPKNRLLPILTAFVILAGIGYYSYTKFFTGNDNNSNLDSTASTTQLEPQQITEENVSDAMPVETVENVNLKLTTNEGNAVSIPAIERNLDASIAISNLSIDFVVPSAYKSSKTAVRYLSKMGKIIQLNLKTEMLLLTKQPITNRIEVELEYNKNSHAFDVKNILASSGEKAIDDLIVQTIKNALSINLNMNMNVFNNISGNPVLVIKL